MKDIQTVACFNTRSPVLHLFLPIQYQIHNNSLNFTFLGLFTAADLCWNS